MRPVERNAISRGTNATLHTGQPDQQLQGALRIWHFIPTRNEGVDPLSRQTEQTSQVHLLAVSAQPGTQLTSEFIPERSFVTRAQGFTAARASMRT